VGSSRIRISRRASGRAGSPPSADPPLPACWRRPQVELAVKLLQFLVSSASCCALRGRRNRMFSRTSGWEQHRLLRTR
jgi:hypothetical protein